MSNLNSFVAAFYDAKSRQESQAREYAEHLRGQLLESCRRGRISSRESIDNRTDYEVINMACKFLRAEGFNVAWNKNANYITLTVPKSAFQNYR